MLGSKAQRALSNASRLGVEAALVSAKQNFTNARWVRAGNRYEFYAGGQLKRDSKAGTTNSVELSEFVSTSAVVHCLDGWAYLSRGLEAHSRADFAAARHFAYYAELRAAMSFLASEGIGVLDSVHVIIDDLGNTQTILGGGTHEFAWDALNYFASTSGASDSISAFVRPGGIALRDWTRHFPLGSGVAGATGPSPRTVAAEWLRDWGLDIQDFVADRQTRNASSYGPHYGHTPGIVTAETSAFVREVWKTLEPPDFAAIDRHLVRCALEGLYRGRTGREPNSNRADFEGRIDVLLAKLGLGANLRDTWKNFLMRTSSPDDALVVREARGRGNPHDARSHLRVASRACLLLRLATGSTKQLLTRTSCSRSDIEFWWHPLGASRALWHTTGKPARVADLWTDVEGAILELDEWERRNPGADQRSWRADNHRALFDLTGCELAGLWGLGL